MSEEMNQYYHDDVLSSFFSHNTAIHNYMQGFEGATQDLSPLMSFNDFFSSSSLDYSVLARALDVPIASAPELKQEHGVVAMVDAKGDQHHVKSNLSTSPNSSASCSSTEVGVNVDEDSKDHEDEAEKDGKEADAKDGVGEEEATDKSKKVTKPKVKGEKRQREPRFAFMTKSEVDNLEDGYRWRKYGQKAVKNSPYARSYYRCTTQKCSVKKRVERSLQDPTIVITTYEGQHTHPSPATVRGSSHFYAPPTMSTTSFGHDILMNQISPLLKGSSIGQLNVAAQYTNPSLYMQSLQPPAVQQLQFPSYDLSSQDMMFHQAS